MRAESWSAIYEAQLDRYRTIFDADHNMDAKSGVTLGATLAIAAFALSRGLFMTQDNLLRTFLIVGCVLYAITILATMYVLKPRPYALPAVTTKERPGYLTKSDDDLMYQLIVDVEAAAEKIESNLRSKALALKIGLWCFAGGTVILFGVKLVGG